MKSEPYVVGKYSFLVGSAAFYVARKYLAEFTETTELIEESEIPHVAFIVGEHFVENPIAVLKTACMHGNNQNTLLEKVNIANE